MKEFYDFLYDVHKTKYFGEQKKTIDGRFEVLNGDLNRWIISVKNFGLYSEFYSSFEKVIKGVINKVFCSLPSLEINENIHEKIFTAQEIVHEMYLYLNSFCEFHKNLKELTEDLSTNPTNIELNSIIAQWNYQHFGTYKKSTDDCIKHLRNAIEKVKKREQKEQFSYISTIYSKTKDIIVLVQKDLKNISVQLPRKKKKKLMLIYFD